MTLDKLVYDIREALKEYSDDSELDNRYIEYLWALKRAKYIRQDLDRFGRNFNTTILQSFCSPLEEVSTQECGLDLTCDKILRTTLPIPTLLQLSTKNSLYRVSPADKLSEKFTVIERNRAYSSKDSLFDYTKAFLHDDDRLYLFNKSGVYLMDCISITGVFEDPLELQNYKDCCDCEDSNVCYDPYNDTYPISPQMIDPIRSEIIKELAATDVRLEDKQNNAEDEA